MSTVAQETNPPTRAKTFEINHAGDVHAFAYVANETILKVIELAIVRFRLAAQPHQLGLFKPGATQALEPSSTLEHAGVRPGETLILKPIVVQGG